MAGRIAKIQGSNVYGESCERFADGTNALNKPNQVPLGLLEIGLQAFLAPGHHAPDARPDAALQTEPVGALTPMLHSLRQRRDWTGPWYKRGVTALKYLVRSACLGAQHQRFLALISADASMRAYRQRDPRLQERHMHRFINAHWRSRDRLTYLQQHYRFAMAHLPRALFEQVYAMGYANLGSLTAKDGSLLTLYLRPPIDKGCEGELCLQLCDAGDAPLYTIVFSVADERPTLMVGCLQGPRGANARDRVRELTRNLHGMRPKQLMLALAYAFARRYGIERIVAIANDAHPLRRSGRPVYADYDAFWEEQQGRRIGGGWFVLPSSPAQKSEAEVPSQHRAAFRRREALRRTAEQLLTHALGGSPDTPLAVVAGFRHGP